MMATGFQVASGPINFGQSPSSDFEYSFGGSQQQQDLSYASQLPFTPEPSAWEHGQAYTDGAATGWVAQAPRPAVEPSYGVTSYELNQAQYAQQPYQAAHDTYDAPPNQAGTTPSWEHTVPVEAPTLIDPSHQPQPQRGLDPHSASLSSLALDSSIGVGGDDGSSFFDDIGDDGEILASAQVETRAMNQPTATQTHFGQSFEQQQSIQASQLPPPAAVVCEDPLPPPTYEPQQSSHVVPPPAALHSVASSMASSTGGSPRRANAAVEAGKRKLEEFKRKKHAAMARRGGADSGTPSPAAGVKPRTTTVPVQVQDTTVAVAVLEAQLAAALQRAEAAEAASSGFSRDLDSVLRQLEAVDAERNALQRDKAALVGETVALRASVAAAAEASAAVAVAEEEVSRVGQVAEEALRRADEMEAAIEAKDAEHAQQIAQLENQFRDALATQQDPGVFFQSPPAPQQAESADVQGMAALVDQLNEQLQLADQEMKQAQEALSIERGQKEESEALVEAARSDITALVETLAEGEAERVALEQRQQANQTRIAELEGQLAGVSQQAHTEVQQYGQSTSYNEDIAAWQAALMQAQQAQQYAEAQCQELHTALQQAQQAAFDATTRAETAEISLAAAQEALVAEQQQVVALSERCTSLQGQIDATVAAPPVTTPSASKIGTRIEDPVALRMRLEKAEAAVEKERSTIQSLERQVREGRAAAEEGRSATAAALDLRVKLDAVERELSVLKFRLQDMEPRAPVPSAGVERKDDDVKAAIKAAEERAGTAEAAAHDLRSQCDSSARLVNKLMDENAELATHLNRLSEEAATLRAAMNAAGKFVQAADLDAALAEAEAVHLGASPMTPKRLLLDDELSTLQRAGSAPASLRQQKFTMSSSQKALIGAGGPWDLPGSTMQQLATPESMDPGQMTPSDTRSESGGQKRQGGYSFWSWVAGADVADSYT